MNSKPTVNIFTDKEKLISDKEQTINVLVRISPPQLDSNGFSRPKLNIGIALDRSGSMQGQKMHEAREAAKYCVDQLLPHDRFSTVIFDDQIDVLFTSQQVTDKDMFKRGIDRINSRNSTALHQGWVSAGLQVSEHLDNDAINRVLLITDGQANVGETNVDRIVDQARQLAARGVSTSTIGIGQDFNEDLLMPMAEAGQGNSWHVEEPQDMVRIFETELRGLVTQIAHSVTFGVKPAAGVSVADVLNDFEINGEGRYQLPNLQAGSPLNVVVRLRLPAHPEGTTVELAEFSLDYIDQGSNVPECIKSVFKADFATAAKVDSLPENAEVLEAVQLLMNARARREAVERMDRHDFAGAAQALAAAAFDTDISFCKSESPRLQEELEDFALLKESLNFRENDALSRKKMAYRRETLRKNK